MDEIFQFITQIDTQVFLTMNDLHNPVFDDIMWVLTGKFTWVPLYAVLLWWLYKRFQWRVATVYLIAVILTIVIADQVCGGVLRGAIGRLRPANLNNPISSMVHIVNDYRGGNFGFPSCHAANSFGLAMIISLIMRRRWFTWCIFGWALLNSYTRLYLGVHYPGDLLVGAIIGSLAGLLMYWVSRKWPMAGNTEERSASCSCEPHPTEDKCDHR